MGDRQEAPRLRSVLLPAEHGGWSLTLEPVALGLIVAPSAAGALLGLGALAAFLVRVPMRVVLVDRFRGRWLPRTTLAVRAAAIEGLALAALGAGAVVLADASFWPPLALAAPVVAVALAFDARSRSRRAGAEIAGSVAIASVAAAIALAAGEDQALAYGLWAIAAARAVAAIGFVRVQIRRSKHQPPATWVSDLTQVIAIVVVAVGWAVDALVIAAVAIVVVVGVVHAVLVRRPVPRVAVVGAQQVVIGLTVVLVSGLATIAP